MRLRYSRFDRPALDVIFAETKVPWSAVERYYCSDMTRFGQNLLAVRSLNNWDGISKL